MNISESEFGRRVSRFPRVLYLCHRNADPDAIGSAFALSQAFGGTIGVVDDLSRTGDALAAIIGARITINPDPASYDLVVVVDTSVRLQLGSFAPARYALIDHHLDKGLLKDAEFYIQKPCKSTSEIVWAVLGQSRVHVTREMALGLLVGIISDTGRFKRSTPQAFRAASELLRAGELDYEDALQALSVPSDISRRIAILKAASRAEIERLGDWLLAITYVNSFEGSAAMALVDLGADVAFAAGVHEESCRISARAGRAASRAGLNLAEILGKVGKKHGGEGGGHRAAAALEAKAPPETLLAECKKMAAEGLERKQP